MAVKALQLWPVLLAWAAVFFKLPALRRNRHDPAPRAYWLGLVGVALTLTVLLPPVYLAVDQLAGVPNLARLLAHGLALAAGCSVQAFLLLLSYPASTAWHRIHRRGWALASTLVTMTGLFALAPVDDETIEFTTRYADAPLMPEYWLVFLAYLGLTGVEVARLSWRYARLSDRPALRLGLRLTAVGALFGLGYIAYEGSYVAMRRLGVGAPPGDLQAVTQALLAGAAGLIVVGSTMPTWGPRIGLPRLWRWFGRYRAFLRLRPLWLALYRSSPEIALVPPTPWVVEALTVRDLDFRLYRRVIEVRDGRLMLRTYLDPRVQARARTLGRAAGLAGDRLDAAVEASSLASALRARRKLRPATSAQALGAPGGPDLDAEVAWLVQVARCFVGSPLVRAVVAELEAADHGIPQRASPGRP
jgi:hypothetical protein